MRKPSAKYFLVFVLFFLASLTSRNFLMGKGGKFRGEVDFQLLQSLDQQAFTTLSPTFATGLTTIEYNSPTFKGWDFLWSEQIQGPFKPDWDGFSFNQFNYRKWVRFQSSKYEFRIGKQEIFLGHARFLRPLALFDQIDPTDTTRKTPGSDSLKFRYFFNPHSELTGWMIKEGDRQNPGVRFNKIIPHGEGSLLIHQRGEQEPLLPGGFQLKETILGGDFFLDIGIGLWGEAGYHQSNGGDFWNGTLGIDQTFANIGRGLHVTLEAFLQKSVKKRISEYNALAFSWDLPVNDDSSLFFLFIQEDLYQRNGGQFRIQHQINPSLTSQLAYNFSGKSIQNSLALIDFLTGDRGLPLFFNSGIELRIIYYF